MTRETDDKGDCLLLSEQHDARIKSDALDGKRERVHETKLLVFKWLMSQGQEQRAERYEEASADLGNTPRPNKDQDRSLRARKGKDYHLNDGHSTR